ncbi:MAG: SDR family NAD(P)-dependent oxidoreductase [Pseudomonas sp.]
MTGQLAGKTAIVTGAASGIGLAITRLYLTEGAEMLAVDQQCFDAADLQSSDKLATSSRCSCATLQHRMPQRV